MSFKGYRRQIRLEFDYDQVKEGVPSVSKQMAILNAEFRKSNDEARATGKEIDKLGTRYDFLSNKIKIQEQDVEKYRDKLEKATNAKGNNTKAIENNTASLQIAEAKLAQTRAQLDQVTQELEKQKTTLGKTSAEWKDLSEQTARIGKSMTMKLTVPILAAAGASFKLGADFEQALGKVDAVFEDNAEGIKKWSESALKDFGLARSTAVEMAGDFGALFKGMGIDIAKTEEWSKTLTERTMDLANFYDTTVEETQRALNAIVTGQTEPLRRFGINMTQATLQEYALSKGIRTKISDMTEAEKVQLRYNYVIERTNIALGTTARESDTATGQMNRFREGVEELGVGFSTHILPVFTPLIEGLNTAIQRFTSLSDETKKFIVYGGLVVAAVGPIISVLSNVFKVISTITQGTKLAKKAVDGVSTAGAAIGGLMKATGSFGFKEWALAIAGVVALLTALLLIIDQLFNKGRGLNNIARSLSNSFSGVGGAVNTASYRGNGVVSKYVDGSHMNGLDYVPHDGYIAELHRGERVVPADKNNAGETFNLTLNVKMDEVDDVSKLVKIAKDFKQTYRAGIVRT